MKIRTVLRSYLGIALAVIVPAVLGLTMGAGLTVALAAERKPAIVFVHGAFEDAGSWDTVAADLHAKGYPVLALDNPLRGLRSDTKSIGSIVERIGGPVILVGHSYGGAVINAVGRTARNVVGLVFVAAQTPAPGEPTPLTVDPIRFPGSKLFPALQPALGTIAPGSGGPRPSVAVVPEAFRDVLAADVPAEKVAQMISHQRPLAMVVGFEPAPAAGYDVHPSWWLLPTQDNAIPPMAQRSMAARAHSHVTEIAASHSVEISHPKAVTAMVIAADKGTR